MISDRCNILHTPVAAGILKVLGKQLLAQSVRHEQNVEQLFHVISVALFRWAVEGKVATGTGLRR